MGVRRQARRHLRCHRADEGPLHAGHHRDRLPLQRQGQEEGFLRLRPEAADAAHPVLEGHAGNGGLQGKRHSRHLEGILVVLVRQGPAGLSQGHQQPRLRNRQPDGCRVDRLVPVVPELGRCLQRQAGRRFGQAPGRRSEGARRPDLSVARLYRRLHQGLLAAVVDDLEGPRQQRRLPQSHDDHDAQLHDLDRGQVAGRRQQRAAHARAARRRPQGLRRADRHRRLPQEARRHADGLSHGGQGRRDLPGLQEQAARA